MSEFELEPDTWKQGNGLASWYFSMPSGADEDVMQALLRHVLGVLRGLDAFARVRSAEWTTEASGEESIVLTGAQLTSDAVVDAFARARDTEAVDLDLDLLCVATSGAPFVVRYGARVTVDIAEPGVHAIRLRLRLDADLYSPRTHGSNPENGPLAELNAPRLGSFLRYIRETMLGVLIGIEAPGYRTWVYEDGFRSP